MWHKRELTVYVKFKFSVQNLNFYSENDDLTTLTSRYKNSLSMKDDDSSNSSLFLVFSHLYFNHCHIMAVVEFSNIFSSIFKRSKVKTKREKVEREKKKFSCFLCFYLVWAVSFHFETLMSYIKSLRRHLKKMKILHDAPVCSWVHSV